MEAMAVATTTAVCQQLQQLILQLDKLCKYFFFMSQASVILLEYHHNSPYLP